MKKRFLHHLLVIVGVILLIGFVASCGGDSEPQFKVIESKAYTAANDKEDTDQLNYYYNQKAGGKSPYPGGDVAGGAKEIYTRYRSDVTNVIDDEMGKKNPAYGLLLVVKVDKYKLIGRVRWTNKPYWSLSYWMFDYN